MRKQVLIESGAATLEAHDLWGETALLKAARQGRKKVVQLLLRYGAMMGARDD